MIFNLVIKPSINPKARHLIEDALEESGYSIIGGGQTAGEDISRSKSFSDISFENTEPYEAEEG